MSLTVKAVLRDAHTRATSASPNGPESAHALLSLASFMADRGIGDIAADSERTAVVQTLDGEQHIGVLPTEAAEPVRLVDLLPESDGESHIVGTDPETDTPDQVAAVISVLSAAAKSVGTGQRLTARELVIGLAAREETLNIIALGITGD